MRNLTLAFAVLSFVCIVQADVCHTQTITVGGKQIEMFRIEDSPDDMTGVKSKMLVSGVYQFVPKKVLSAQDVKSQNYWHVRRCVKAISKIPIYDPTNCEVKNDFEFGSFVAKDSKGNKLQKVSKRGAGTLGITLPNAVEQNEFHVVFNPDLIGVTEHVATGKIQAKRVAICDYNPPASAAPSDSRRTKSNK